MWGKSLNQWLSSWEQKTLNYLESSNNGTANERVSEWTSDWWARGSYIITLSLAYWLLINYLCLTRRTPHLSYGEQKFGTKSISFSRYNGPLTVTQSFKRPPWVVRPKDAAKHHTTAVAVMNPPANGQVQQQVHAVRNRDRIMPIKTNIMLFLPEGKIFRLVASVCRKLPQRLNASGCVLLRKAEKGKGNFQFFPFYSFSLRKFPFWWRPY